MQRVYGSLSGHYDLWLVFLAGLICVCTCLVSTNIFVRANDAERDRPLSWLFMAAAIFGAGVWATHFVFELAYEPGFPISYDPGLTGISFLEVIGAVWLGMFVVHRFAAPVLGGAIIGAGIAAMHYIGLAALRAPAELHWNGGYIPVSVVIVMTGTATAMRILAREPAVWGRLMAVMLLVLGIAGHHFAAMAALTFVPDALVAVPGHAVAAAVLAITLATVMAFVAALGLLGVTADNYLAERLRCGADHLARAQRIAHTGSIEQDLRTGIITWSAETYRISV